MDYKKTLEDIVKIINTTEKCDDGFVNICNYIYENCPELSESKDERIRKELIAIYSVGAKVNAKTGSIFDKDIVAWLEKQGKKEVDPRYENLEELLIADDIYQMSMNDAMVEEAKSKAINALSELEISKLLGIGKQGEKKSTDKIKPKFKIGDQVTNGYYTCKIENIDDTTYYCSDSSFISRFDIKDQDRFELVDQETDFKPKFQEGDWIVNNNCGGVYQVTEIRDNEYCLWPLDAEIMGYSRIIDVDNEYHLWTIQDAKDGDILSDGTMIVIFKRFEEPSYRQHIVAYVGLDTFGNIQITNDTWELGRDKVYPATNEQCDLLFKKMKEVGCKFNNDTKKLETIDNNELFKYINYENYRRKSNSL